VLASFGVSYKKTSLSSLDALTFRDVPAFYNILRHHPGISGSLLLQTCNRVELFLDAADPVRVRDEVLRHWALETKFKLAELEKLVESREGAQVVEYLVQLASGLESMMVGENQIIGQLKNSLQEAQSNQATSPRLEDAMYRSLSAASMIRERTGIGRGTVSLGSAAVKVAEEALGTLDKARVMLLGTGQVGMLVMKSLKARGVANITVASRTRQRTESFCRTFGGTPVDFQSVPSQLAKMDLVIVATRATNYVLTKNEIQSHLDRNRELGLVILDLSNPRNVSPDVSGLDGVVFRTIDDLRGIADETLAKRRELVKQAEPLVRESVDKIVALLNREEAEPLVSDIYRRADEIREQELGKALSMLKLTGSEEEVVKNMSISLVERLLDQPVVSLRRAAERRDGRLLTVAGQIFGGE
jgi:glutamyl-tRNA reductase